MNARVKVSASWRFWLLMDQETGSFSRSCQSLTGLIIRVWLFQVFPNLTHFLETTMMLKQKIRVGDSCKDSDLPDFYRQLVLQEKTSRDKKDSYEERVKRTKDRKKDIWRMNNISHEGGRKTMTATATTTRIHPKWKGSHTNKSLTR